jgi:hypothetical protein
MVLLHRWSSLLVQFVSLYLRCCFACLSIQSKSSFHGSIQCLVYNILFAAVGRSFPSGRIKTGLKDGSSRPGPWQALVGTLQLRVVGTSGPTYVSENSRLGRDCPTELAIPTRHHPNEGHEVRSSPSHELFSRNEWGSVACLYGK